MGARALTYMPSTVVIGCVRCNDRGSKIATSSPADGFHNFAQYYLIEYRYVRTSTDMSHSRLTPGWKHHAHENGEPGCFGVCVL